MPRPKKKPLDLKSDEAMKKLLPPDIVREAKKAAREANKKGS